MIRNSVVQTLENSFASLCWFGGNLLNIFYLEV